MYSTHEAKLDLPTLPLAARHVHIVLSLSTHSLLSMGQLCNAGCQITFDAASVHVRLHHEVITTGARAPNTGLWHPSLVNLVTADTLSLHQSLAAVAFSTPTDLVAFAHASLFSPALSTLKTALDRCCISNFHGLTAQALSKFPPHSIAMIKRHLDQAQKNQRSTKLLQPDITSSPPLTSDGEDDTNDIFPHSDPKTARTHHCFAAVCDPATGQIHSNQTGRFVVASSTGNN
jgi:hypothetical protein